MKNDEVINISLYIQIDENVAREIINHRSLRHPNIIRFKEVIIVLNAHKYLLFSFLEENYIDGSEDDDDQVILTPTHLAIVMEYASGGELFERICTAGRFSEHEVPTSLFLYFVHNFLFLHVAH